MSKPGHQHLLERLDDLVQKIEGADIRVPEDSALIGIAKDLVPHVYHMLRQGIEILTEIEDFYSPEHLARNQGLDSNPDSLNEIGLIIASEFAARDLNDVAFLARTDLRARLDKLVTTASQSSTPISRVALASGCESGLRSLRRALVSVESALCEFENLDPPMRPWFDLEISLQIRRLYWNLRRETESPLERGDRRGLEQRLRAALYRIVAFRELSIYPFLRVDDRVQMRQLLRRMLSWLNDSDQDFEEGRHLWEDLQAFAEILFQVSYRHELRDHDHELLDRTFHVLFSGPGEPPALPDSLRQKLESVLGLDDTLDRLILDAQQPSEAWRIPLARLLPSLRPGGKPNGLRRSQH